MLLPIASFFNYFILNNTMSGFKIYYSVPTRSNTNSIGSVSEKYIESKGGSGVSTQNITGDSLIYINGQINNISGSNAYFENISGVNSNFTNIFNILL